jgi:inhibitor of KinA sporulation pathway (predicted exonuclease)
MHILVVSIETTCWEAGAKPADEESEIIEVGACLLDTTTGARSNKRTFKVRPTRSTISLYCILQTGSTSWAMKRAISFLEVCLILEEEYVSKDRTWASFGQRTQSIFERQCADMGVAYPFSRDHIDVQKHLVQQFRVELASKAQARQLLGLPLEHYYRSSGNSACEIATILYKMLPEPLIAP